MELQVPEARLFAVEYPGYVQHEDRVLESLGSLDGIARQLQDNADVLPLKFRCVIAAQLARRLPNLPHRSSGRRPTPNWLSCPAFLGICQLGCGRGLPASCNQHKGLEHKLRPSTCVCAGRMTHMPMPSMGTSTRAIAFWSSLLGESGGGSRWQHR